MCNSSFSLNILVTARVHVLRSSSRYKEEEHKEDEIRFLIEDEEYRLLWWNERGKHDANALSMVKCPDSSMAGSGHGGDDQKSNDDDDDDDDQKSGDDQKKELHYMRFCRPDTLKWQWYSNDEARFMNYDENDQELLDELEVTFLSNVHHNFDPQHVSQKFHHCLLPKLKLNMERNGRKTSRRDFSLRCAMDPMGTGNIRSMEQQSFDHDGGSVFPRTARRMVDGRDSIEFLYRDSNSFIKVCVHSGSLSLS